MVSVKSIRIEDNKIQIVKQWPEPQSVQDIQVFLGFANFYKQFIQEIIRINTPLTLILKTWSTKLAKSGRGGAGVGGDSKARRNGSELDGSGTDDVEVDGVEVEDDEVGKKGRKMSKSKNLSNSKKMVGSDFFILGARLAFTKLRPAFVKAPILHHFDTERYIQVEINASGYTIGGVFSQLTSNDLGQWYPMTFFLQNMIPAETRYKTHDGELLAIVEALKTWKHYLEGS